MPRWWDSIVRFSRRLVARLRRRRTGSTENYHEPATNINEADEAITTTTRVHALSQGQVPTQLHQSAVFTPFTEPHLRPNITSRPEFTPFTVAHLCATMPFDYLDFWTFPQRHGWKVHVRDAACHVLCPPGFCRHSGQDLGEPRAPQLSHSDDRPVLGSEKAAFLQAWLFFGVLAEVSALCGLELDVQREFVVDGGNKVSSEKLNGLSERWFNAARDAGRLGDKTTVESILAVARHARLMLSSEKTTKYKPKFEYTFEEGWVFQMLDIVVRVVGLHLLAQVAAPGFAGSDEEGWGQQRILNSIEAPPGVGTEGLFKLHFDGKELLAERGWCRSELAQIPGPTMIMAQLLDRPRIRDHSLCGEIRMRCDAYQTDEKTYKTRHISDDCTCAFVETLSESLVDILAAEQIPKIIVSEQLELSAVGDANIPYIAISHVCMRTMLPCQPSALRN
jgi:hypothetical protein